ncbi:N-formylglutamate amidohydrolase [Chthonobacter rhizosphaerae]|uniref:N-formylglutamate amidohydrolase n=1 Tax=Chthonobacter rhizosphaerae TaxID=2735553 RepID=UPI0015EF6508|nr:N-formylglutamate amidohydrolase [Chthonobacter rhizosphaerae]
MRGHVEPIRPTADWPAPVEVIAEAGTSDFVLVCEHASNHIPAEYAGLGLPPSELTRHIAWDIGAADLTRRLSARLGAPAVLGAYSRLLVDLNRPFGAPTAIPTRSEATEIPGNKGLDDRELARRRSRIFDPFHARVAGLLGQRRQRGRATLLVTVHSFTPVFLGVARPWHAGILFDRSGAFAHHVLDELAAEGLTVAPNEPYTVDRETDYAIPVYGTDLGLPAILVEVRNDLIADPAGVEAWADRLALALERTRPKVLAA